MAKDYKRYTVTTALPYANGPIHIGHIAGSFLPADIYVRYLRSKKKDVIFIGGSDEHGVPVTIRAQKEGISPQEIVDKYHTMNKKDLEDFGISLDIFSRTSNETHKVNASSFFTKLYNDEKLIVNESEQYYDNEVKQFLADRYIRGVCPICKYDDAYGDQCEKCGSTLSPNELIEPRSALSGAKPILRKTTHWYLPLKKYEQWLKKWILEEHTEWKVNVYGQCKSWLDNGLLDRPITRDLQWGVPVPLNEANGKVLYVWFEAPIGYISATQELCKQTDRNWELYWKNDDTKLVHFVGKDNIVFHCIVFPVMLKAHGGFILPDNVPANEFMNLEGNKISTSRNYAIWLHDYLLEYTDKQDVLRYVLCANMPETKDSDFTMSDFKSRNNNELVAILGNFVNRTVSLIHKCHSGIVPEVVELTPTDIALFASVNDLIKRIEDSINTYHFRDALQYWMDIARAGNKYISDEEPWHAINSNPERVKTVLNVCIHLVAKLAIVGEPFVPFTSKKLFLMLDIHDQLWDMSYKNDIIRGGVSVDNVGILFDKIQDLHFANTYLTKM